ncbi:very-long-chain 3-oxoacyl-CoA reductase [Neodiprion pinetum]|uniref:Very-long-chain 3-oxoacyl-CoA reductase n=1 Tax=Neodiprion lecontei TaxID=441921 RepID=A0A6J0C0N6_NEOLC|nr:very-long-chain 3-oxoacyl-CoA reductase [Neodiprion lecontei]XP_015520125.1 very-long-chain 3-oxoacyl-CoA reductase [Neodiprion lecontei]XP_015520128.1 very-long-chain 3-oxoacyl-CoA reductase [Neodiprion lecontei]XP_046476794.1 very-long-chain 3-oxoacyl-CoA reductase-like [Neodiprion pinetum]XP_046476795.1 very-long-chain 3-oxoacyl-CoA reductase-like [Neodiprion pinetum]XP_046476796.1 very-long-chain 3-oxoacyl-CoA reductase-like [Neodiprion pinetum]XP_046476797.1 very-long-chain 3-oxoacyl-
MVLSCWEKITIVVVAAVGLRILIRASGLAWKKLIAPQLGLGLDVASQGRWAVVTGATDGIGKAFAEALAAKGLDILLVSRSLPKLEQVATDIKQRFGIETRVLEADLTQGQPVYAKIATCVEELEVGVLVNNAGTSYEHPEVFTNLSEETIARILQLNVAGVTGVARAILPGMMERRKGVIINISSTSAAIPSPYLSVYSASKSYVDKLSADLAVEAAPRGVTVQCVLPGPVATKMSKIRRSTWMAPSAEKFVESLLKTVGIESRTTGYFPHSLLLGTINAIRCVCDKAAIWLIARTMLNLRNRALRKKDKDEQKTVESIPNRLTQATTD